MTQFENYCTVPGFEFSTRYCGYFLHLIYVGRGAVFRSACQVEDGSGWNHAAFVYLLSFLEIQINTSFESFILAPLGSKQVGFGVGWLNMDLRGLDLDPIWLKKQHTGNKSDLYVIDLWAMTCNSSPIDLNNIPGPKIDS